MDFRAIFAVIINKRDINMKKMSVFDKMQWLEKNK